MARGDSPSSTTPHPARAPNISHGPPMAQQPMPTAGTSMPLRPSTRFTFRLPVDPVGYLDAATNGRPVKIAGSGATRPTREPANRRAGRSERGANEGMGRLSPD